MKVSVHHQKKKKKKTYRSEIADGTCHLHLRSSRKDSSLWEELKNHSLDAFAFECTQQLDNLKVNFTVSVFGLVLEGPRKEKGGKYAVVRIRIM